LSNTASLDDMQGRYFKGVWALTQCQSWFSSSS